MFEILGHPSIYTFKDRAHAALSQKDTKCDIAASQDHPPTASQSQAEKLVSYCILIRISLRWEVHFLHSVVK